MSAEFAATSELSPLDGLGDRIRLLRSQRNMTLQELSKRSLVSVAMLSHIERGRSAPSIKVLDRIRLALDVPFSIFFEDSAAPASEDERNVISRKADRPFLTFAATGLRKELASPVRGTQLEMMILHLDQDGHSGDEPWRRDGEKCGMVMSGRFELTIGAQRFTVEEGDAFQFDSSMPHSFRNLAPEPTKVLWIVFSRALG